MNIVILIKHVVRLKPYVMISIKNIVNTILGINSVKRMSNRRMKRNAEGVRIMKKIVVISGGILVITIGILAGTFRKNNNHTDKYTFVEVTRGNLENTITATGTLNPVSTVEVGTQVSGIINRVYVDFNELVRKNQLLAVLDTTILAVQVRDAEANLLKSRAQFNEAKFDVERTEKLFEKNLLSELEYVTSKTKYETALASLQSAQNNLRCAHRNLKYAFIRSPINGTVIHRNVEEGQTVAASFQTPTLFLIAEDLSQMEIHAQVDESDIGRIKEGQPVRFEVQAYDDRVFTGTVRQIWLQPQTVQNVVNYTVVVDAENDEGLLLPGMTATIDFIVEQREGVLLVPASALKIQPTEDMVTTFRRTTEEQLASLPDSVHGRSPEKGSGQTGLGIGMGMGMQNIAGSAQRGNNRALIWYLDDEEKLRAQTVKTGVSDGKHTEIVAVHGIIEEGMQVIDSVRGESADISNERSGRMLMSGFGPRRL